MQRLYYVSLRAAYQRAAPDRLSGTDVVAVAHDAVFEIGSIPYARAGEQDAPLDGRARSYPAVAPDGHVSGEGDPPPDNRVPPYQYVALDGGRRVDLSVLADPQALPALRAGDLDPHPPREHVVLGLAVGLERPDVRPVEVALVADEPLPVLQELREDVPGEVEEDVLGNVFQSPRFQDVDAGVGQRADRLLRVRLLLEPQDVPLAIHLDHPELRSVVDPMQRYGGQSAPLLVEGDELLDVHIRQGVARDDDEGVVEPLGEALDAAGRAPQLVFPAQVDLHAVGPRLLAVSLQQGVGQVVDVDVDLLYAVGGEKVEDVLDYGGVHDRSHGFGNLSS